MAEVTAQAVQPGGRRNGAAAVLLAGTVGMLALPSAVLALSSRFDQQPLIDSDPARPGGFRPAEVDPRLARSITVRALSKGRTFQFTPAAMPSRMDRSLTVAVRLNSPATREIVVRGPVQSAGNGSSIKIAPTAYSLGVTRSGKTLAQGGVSDSRRSYAPNLSAYTLAPGAPSDPSRFSPRIELDERSRAGRSPRTLEGQGDQTVDLGGSYRVTGNLNVTAGVRYSSERNRIDPLTEGKQESQAVYVGTQFRF
ncbi:MAG: hypothetical protein KGM49_09925 [Sphingomonadales bacterium]|nr:hypothetical protein [Sphingomonadales bacterium]